MKRNLLPVVLALLCAATLSHAQLSSTGTTNLSVNIGAEAALTVGNSTSLASTGTTFSNYTGTTSLTYFVRTINTGTITLQVSGDFSPSGGPSVATPPTAGDKLTYNCSMNPPGKNGTASNCPANTQALTSGATAVAGFGADARSIQAGNTGTVNWTMTNDPAYKAGNYSATVTFTISAS
jgi:hypothetical protein